MIFSISSSSISALRFLARRVQPSFAPESRKKIWRGQTTSELEQFQLLQAKKAIGVSVRQLLREAGYGAEDIRRIESELKEEKAAEMIITGEDSSDD